MSMTRKPLALFAVLALLVQLFVLPVGQASASAAATADSEPRTSFQEGNKPSTVVTMRDGVPVYTTDKKEGSKRSAGLTGAERSVVASGDILTVVVPMAVDPSDYYNINIKLATKEVYGSGSTHYYYNEDYLYREGSDNYDYTVNYSDNSVEIKIETIDWSVSAERFLILSVGGYAIQLPVTTADKGTTKTVDLSGYVPVSVQLPNTGSNFSIQDNIVNFVDSNKIGIGAVDMYESTFYVKPATYFLQINAIDDDKAYFVLKPNVAISNATNLSIASSELAKVTLQMDDEEFLPANIGGYPTVGGFRAVWHVNLTNGGKTVNEVLMSKLDFISFSTMYQKDNYSIYIRYHENDKSVTSDYTYATDTNLQSKINLTKSSYKAGYFLYGDDYAGVVDERGNRVGDIFISGSDANHSVTFTNKATNEVTTINPHYLASFVDLPAEVGDYTMTFTPGEGADYFGLQPVSTSIKLTENGSDVTLSSLSVNKSSVNMIGIDKSEAITATATFSDSSKKNVTELADWSSSNDAVATVADGVITSTGVGSANITVSYGGKSQTIKVSVVAKQLKTLVASPNKLTGRMGDNKDVTLTATYSDNSTEVVTEAATWTSSKAEVASFADGQVQVNGYGTATLTAELGGKKATVSVNSAVKNVYIGTTTTDKPKLLSLKPGDSAQLVMKAQFADSAGNKPEVIESGVEWSVADPEVASVTDSGLLTVNKFGITKVTADYNGLTYTIVVDASIKALNVLDGATSKSIKTLNMHPSQIKTDLVVKATLQDNKQVTVDNDEVTWTSDNENVITVDSNGELEVVGYGKANITAVFGGKPVKIAVSVTLSSLKANLKKITGKGEYVVDLIATYGDKFTEDVSDQAVWTTDNLVVATVEDGLVTVNDFGKAKITAAFGDQASKNYKTVTIPVEVSVKSLTSTTKKIVGVPGQEVEIPLKAIISDGSEETAEALSEGTVWTTGNPNVATVEDGIVTITGVGKTSITAVYYGKKVTVAIDVPFTLSVSPSKPTIAVGESVSYTVTAIFNDGSELDVTDLATMTYTGSGIISVADGTITALNSGSSTITLKYGGKTLTIKVTVPKV